MINMIKVCPPMALLILVFAAPASGHSGGLNVEGCHNNRKTGDYHCHRGTLPPADNYEPNRSAPRSNGNAERLVVKMSRSGICHAPGTTYYAQTVSFMPYQSIGECLAAGGRLPRR
jgi:hypothetical protein